VCGKFCGPMRGWLAVSRRLSPAGLSGGSLRSTTATLARISHHSVPLLDVRQAVLRGCALHCFCEAVAHCDPTWGVGEKRGLGTRLPEKPAAHGSPTTLTSRPTFGRFWKLVVGVRRFRCIANMLAAGVVLPLAKLGTTGDRGVKTCLLANVAKRSNVVDIVERRRPSSPKSSPRLPYLNVRRLRKSSAA